MYILDTNVISELFRPRPEPLVSDWIERHPPEQFFVTSISKAESLLGLTMMPDGKRKHALAETMHGFFDHGLLTPILPFGDREAIAFADLVTHRTRRGLPIGEFDAQIAAVARVSGFAVVTRNVDDFRHCGIEIINPWDHSTT